VRLSSRSYGGEFDDGDSLFLRGTDADVFPFPEEVPDEDGAADEVEAVWISADSVVPSVPPPENPLSLPVIVSDSETWL